MNYTSSIHFSHLSLDARCKSPLAFSLNVLSLISVAGIALTDERSPLYFIAPPRRSTSVLLAIYY